MIPFARPFLVPLFFAVLCTGCSEPNVAPKAEFSDADKQQVEQYKKQATDEWGNKAK